MIQNILLQKPAFSLLVKSRLVLGWPGCLGARLFVTNDHAKMASNKRK